MAQVRVRVLAKSQPTPSEPGQPLVPPRRHLSILTVPLHTLAFESARCLGPTTASVPLPHRWCKAQTSLHGPRLCLLLHPDFPYPATLMCVCGSRLVHLACDLQDVYKNPSIRCGMNGLSWRQLSCTIEHVLNNIVWFYNLCNSISAHNPNVKMA